LLNELPSRLLPHLKLFASVDLVENLLFAQKEQTHCCLGILKRRVRTYLDLFLQEYQRKSLETLQLAALLVLAVLADVN